MLRVVVAAPPAVRTIDDLARLPCTADLAELRLDLLAGGGAWSRDVLGAWIAASPRPVLATVRSRAEGGAFDGAPADAASLLRAAAELGAAWIDVEAAVAPHLGDLAESVRVVLSHHGEGEAPRLEDLGPLGLRVDHVKIARPVDDRAAYERLVREAAAAPASPPRTFVPYGRLGATRGLFVAADRPGLLYGAADAVSSVVAGQPSLLELLDELRAGELGPDASLYALLGNPPSPSPSPAMHNAAFRRLGRDALYVPLPDVAPAEAVELPFEGFSVTMPHKVEALALAEEVDASAEGTGAANTLVRRERHWAAANTDASLIDVTLPWLLGRGAFVYGAGGYARAAVAALRRAGLSVRLGARDERKGRAVAEAIGAAFDGPDYRRLDQDLVVVNATPLGIDGEVPAPFAEADLRDLVVLDAPYAPVDRYGVRPETGLVRAAKAGGAAVVADGTTLLVHQAKLQVDWFNRVEGVEAGLLRFALVHPRPLLLLGLRGAGKSAVGRAVAARLGRPFVDLDREVLRITGRSPGTWIREEGVAAFREVEAAALARVVGRRGIVVAAGGGVLEHPDAESIVLHHTTPCLLDVRPGVAADRVRADDADRPVLVPGADAEEEARRLREARDPAWRRVATFVVDANGSVDDTRDEVVWRWTSLHGCWPLDDWPEWI